MAQESRLKNIEDAIVSLEAIIILFKRSSRMMRES